MLKSGLIRLIAVGAVTVVGAGASAQNWSSFWQAEWINGVSVSYNVSTKTLTASVNSGAMVKANGQVREIENFFGFFVLTAADGGGQGPFGATQQSGPAGWTFWDDNQYVAGWKDSNKSNLGSPKQGTFATLNSQHIGWFGLHVTYKNTNGLTEYVRFNGGTPPTGNPVPEPFTMGLGLAGVGVFIRRRMKSRSR